MTMMIPKILKMVKGESSEPDDLEDLGVDPQVNDILSVLGIEPVLTLPEDILSTKSIQRTQFKKSKPVGYYPRDVDEFVSDVTLTVKFLYAALHQRNQDIVSIGNEFNSLQNTAQNQKYESEFANLKAEMASEGSTLEAMTKLQNDNQAQRETIEQLEHEVLALSNKIAVEGQHASSPPEGAISEDERAEFDAWAKDVSEKYEALALTNAQLTQQLEEKDGQVEQFRAVALEWEEYANQIAEAIENDGDQQGEGTEELSEAGGSEGNYYEEEYEEAAPAVQYEAHAYEDEETGDDDEYDVSPQPVVELSEEESRVEVDDLLDLDDDEYFTQRLLDDFDDFDDLDDITSPDAEAAEEEVDADSLGGTFTGDYYVDDTQYEDDGESGDYDEFQQNPVAYSEQGFEEYDEVHEDYNQGVVIEVGEASYEGEYESQPALQITEDGFISPDADIEYDDEGYPILPDEEGTGEGIARSEGEDAQETRVVDELGEDDPFMSLLREMDED